MSGIFTTENIPIFLNHMKGALALYMPTLDEFIQRHITKLDPITAKITLIHANMDRKANEKKSAIKIKGNWSSRVKKELREINLVVKAKHPELVDDYFKTTVSRIRTDGQCLAAIEHILSISEMNTRPELKEYTQRLALLRAEGDSVSLDKSSKKTVVSSGSLELKNAIDEFQVQYQKVKLFVHGHFYGTDIDYTQFFLDMSAPKGGKRKANPDLKPVKPVDRIINGTVVVPPPVIAPVIAPEKKNP